MQNVPVFESAVEARDKGWVTCTFAQVTTYYHFPTLFQWFCLRPQSDRDLSRHFSLVLEAKTINDKTPGVVRILDQYSLTDSKTIGIVNESGVVPTELIWSPRLRDELSLLITLFREEGLLK